MYNLLVVILTISIQCVIKLNNVNHILTSINKAFSTFDMFIYFNLDSINLNNVEKLLGEVPS
jgi:hypothetical protein